VNKKITEIIIVLVISIFGSFVAQQIIWPLLLQNNFFSKYQQDEKVVYVTEKKEVFIQENKVLQDTVDKVRKSVIGITSKTKNGTVLNGSGLIITMDGLAVTLAEVVPLNSELSVYVDGSLVVAKVIKRDLDNNLALIKIDKNDLNTLSFTESNKIKLGERVFLLGAILTDDNTINMILNEGSVRSIDSNLITTNMFDDQSLLGSPLIDVEERFWVLILLI